MKVRQVMFPALVLFGAAAIGYGELADPSAEPSTQPQRQGMQSTRLDADGTMEDARSELQRPRECDNSRGVDRECTYM